MYRFAEIEGNACIMNADGGVFKSYGKSNETIESVARARVAALNDGQPTPQPEEEPTTEVSHRSSRFSGMDTPEAD